MVWVVAPSIPWLGENAENCMTTIKSIFKGKFPLKDFVTSKTFKDVKKYKQTVLKDKKGNIVLDADGNEQNFIN
jgi:hypothetical protein